MSTIKLVTSGVSLLVLAVAMTPAAAADLPVKAPPPVAVATVYNWVGLYIGVHGGRGWARKEADGIPTTILGIPVVPNPVTVRPDGWLAGGQIGYNFYQSPTPWWFGGRIVIGVEAQASWADLEESVPCASVSPIGLITANCGVKIDALGSFALRYGTAWDRFLLYSKIGVGWSRDKYETISTSALVPLDFFGEETRWGWMSGTGIEYAFGNNWSGKIEYNYMSLGKERVTLTSVPAAATLDAEIKQRIHVIKFGINYRFGAQPVVARY